MTQEQYLQNLLPPKGTFDCILDTDAYNEIDDQFAIAYLLRSEERCRVKAFYAAPFENSRSNGAADGMEKSFEELKKILALCEATTPHFRGSERFLPDEQTPVLSDAAKDLAKRALNYSPEHPLYIVAIGAITNIASTLLLEPKIKENCVIIWLGGHAYHHHDTKEFNMRQDIAAARVVMGSGAPFVQLPCAGAVSEFYLSKPELREYFKGHGPLAEYLSHNTLQFMDPESKRPYCSKVIWDVCAVAWLFNTGDRFMLSRILPCHLPAYNGYYEETPCSHSVGMVYKIKRDALMEDLIRKINQ